MTPIVHTPAARIEYLDGHRGLAVLLVVFFHAYTRWSALVPYGDQYGSFLPFRYGWAGVELFFLISGFVILMTLEKCSGAAEFLYRRWLRLFPAMAICTAIIFLSAGFFRERPSGIPTLESILPGLTFTEPHWWRHVVGHPIHALAGTFWSLYVEVKFYVFAAVIYYWAGRNGLLAALLAAFAATAAVSAARLVLGPGHLDGLDALLTAGSFRYFGWFAAGAAFHIFARNRSVGWFAAAIGMSLASSVAEGCFSIREGFPFDWHGILATSTVALFFAASTVLKFIQDILTNRIALLFGLISYPLYLIHEDMMVAAIIKLGRHVPEVPPGLIPLPVIVGISTLAFVVARYGEPGLRAALTSAIGSARGDGRQTALPGGHRPAGTEAGQETRPDSGQRGA